MYKKLKDLRKSKKGFTLVELIVVLVILAILAAILVPALLGYIDKAKEKQITTDANTVYTALQSVLVEHKLISYTNRLVKLIHAIFPMIHYWCCVDFLKIFVYAGDQFLLC